MYTDEFIWAMYVCMCVYANYLLLASLCRYRCRSKKLSQRGGATAGSAVMAFNPRPKSEMEQADDPAQHKQDGEMGEG